MIEQIQNYDFGLLRSIITENQVKTLDFSNKNIDSKTAPLIAQALAGLEVTCLKVSHNAIGPLGALALVESLKDSKIIEIDLSRNAIGAAVVDVIRALSLTSIKVVQLAYNQIGAQGLRAIAPLVNSSQLKIDLSHNMTGC